MRPWLVLLGVALLVVAALGRAHGTPLTIVAVSDTEAATLYGGCVDTDSNSDRLSCGDSGGGNCAYTTGPSKFLANGSGKETSVNCGASACGTVPMTSGTCDG